MKTLQCSMVAAMLVALPTLTNAFPSTNGLRNNIVLNVEQGTTLPITLRSISTPNSDPNTPPKNNGDWVLEIKASTALLNAGATVSLVVKQLGNPATLQHTVAIPTINPSSIVFGASVQGVSTATVTVPINAVPDSIGGVASVSLQAETSITEAVTNKVTKSSVSTTTNFNFPQTFGLLGGGNPVPSMPPPPMEERPRPRLKIYMEDYYDWYVGYDRDKN